MELDNNRKSILFLVVSLLSPLSLLSAIQFSAVSLLSSLFLLSPFCFQQRSLLSPLSLPGPFSFYSVSIEFILSVESVQFLVAFLFHFKIRVLFNSTIHPNLESNDHTSPLGPETAFRMGSGRLQRVSNSQFINCQSRKVTTYLRFHKYILILITTSKQQALN